MATLRLEIVTVEEKLFDEDVNMVVAPGTEGVLGILPRHAALLTALSYGELVVKQDGQPDLYFAIGGGMMEVQPNRVIVLADAAERAEQIDLARAEAARKRAEELLVKTKDSQIDFARAEAALRRSITRMKVARRRQKGDGYHGPPGSYGR